MRTGVLALMALLPMAAGCGQSAALTAQGATPVSAQAAKVADDDGDTGAPKEPLTPPRATIRGHVLFVHGHGGDPWRFDRMRRWLEDDGYRTYTMAFPSMEEDMDWLAWFVKGRIREIRRDHGAAEVDLVAHSMGGLISRAYVRYLQGETTTKRVITFESPHHGVPLAAIPFFPRFMISENLRRQVAPGSDFLDKLNEQDETPGNVRYTSIISKNDGYIPVKSAHLEGATNYVISGPNHTTSMWDPVVTGLVKASLAEGRP
ncbi:MAG: alpha/beta fold hydrolase [Candidatus Sericytochromatia bacterium]|nr:alpha/beta fold hydrolase [Candidatus Tanganyikabacteria bacterium]